ncbi:MAG TPA: inositol monophosphatase family protein, partial [Caulobacteraceae bacterium]|nr:inositol monophosphatase family protein [Caulobacteraceae bacterium]
WLTTSAGAVRRELAGPPEPIRARPWPKGQAIALVSHTMKPEHAKALEDRYGFDLKQPMDSSVKLCIIAEGSADIYPRHGTTMEWDIAAGHAVLEAAGGSLTTPEGQAFVYGKASEGFKNGWFVARGA